MRKNKEILDTLLAVVVLVLGILLVGSLSSCRVSSIPQTGCCSTSGVDSTSVINTEVNFDLVKKDGIIIILPTITKDTIK